MTKPKIKHMQPSQKIASEDLFKRKGPRKLLQWAAKFAFWLLTDLEIEGRGNFPEEGEGPLLMVGNHFSMVDIAAFVQRSSLPGGIHRRRHFCERSPFPGISAENVGLSTGLPGDRIDLCNARG